MTYACDIETFRGVIQDLDRYGMLGYGRLGYRQVEERCLPTTEPQVGFQADDLVQTVCAQFFFDNREHLTAVGSQTMQLIRVGCRTSSKAEAIFLELLPSLQTLRNDIAGFLEDAQGLKRKAQADLIEGEKRVKTMHADAKMECDRVVSDAKKHVAHLQGQIAVSPQHAPLHALRKATEGHDLQIRCKEGTLLTAHSLLFQDVPYFNVSGFGERSTIGLEETDSEVVSMLIDYQYGMLETKPRRLLHLVQLGLLALFIGHEPLMQTFPKWIADVSDPDLAELAAILQNVDLPRSPLFEKVYDLIMVNLEELPLVEAENTVIFRRNLMNLLEIGSDPFSWDAHPIYRLVLLMDNECFSDETKERIACDLIASLPEDSIRLAARVAIALQEDEPSPFRDQVERLLIIRCLEAHREDILLDSDWLSLLAWKHIEALSLSPLERMCLQVIASKDPLSREDVSLLHKMRKKREKKALEVLTVRAFFGIGVRKDPEQALKYAREGYALGSGDCAWWLGSIAESRGDTAKAAEWYECAYAKSDPSAAWYRYSLLPDDNPDEQLKWLEKGVKLGCSKSQNNLGKLLIFQGSNDEGLAWLEKAVKGGSLVALKNTYDYFSPAREFGSEATNDPGRAAKLRLLRYRIR